MDKREVKVGDKVRLTAKGVKNFIVNEGRRPTSAESVGSVRSIDLYVCVELAAPSSRTRSGLWFFALDEIEVIDD